MLCVFILFLFLSFSLKSIYFEPVLKHIDARNSSLNTSMDSATKALSEIGLVEEECDVILKHARKEASEYVASSVEKHKEEEQILIEKEKERIKQNIAEFMENLKQEKELVKLAISSESDTFKQLFKSKMAV